MDKQLAVQHVTENMDLQTTITQTVPAGCQTLNTSSQPDPWKTANSLLEIATKELLAEKI